MNWLGMLWANKERLVFVIVLGVVLLVGGLWIAALKTEIAFKQNTITKLGDQLTAQTLELTQTKADLKFVESKLGDFVAAGERSKNNANMWRKKYEEAHGVILKKLLEMDKWEPLPNETECETAMRYIHQYRIADGMR